MSRVCRARGTRILNQHLPSAKALGFLISSRRAGLGARRSDESRMPCPRHSVLYSRFPSAEALGFLIASRRAGLGVRRLISLCHHAPVVSSVAVQEPAAPSAQGAS